MNCAVRADTEMHRSHQASIDLAQGRHESAAAPVIDEARRMADGLGVALSSLARTEEMPLGLGKAPGLRSKMIANSLNRRVCPGYN